MTHIPTQEQMGEARRWLQRTYVAAVNGTHDDSQDWGGAVAEYLKKSAEHLGFALVPLAVTDAKGFDGRADGGRMDEISSAQEG